MASKVRYGLRNTHYAIFNQTTKEYGELKPMPGAISMTLSREGGEGSDFYADDGIYFAFAGTNGGYSGDLTLARITDDIRRDILGEVFDEATGIQYEQVNTPDIQFALVTEMQGNEGPIGFSFYNCKASRPEIAANTRNESPSVDTEALNLRIASQEFTIGDDKVSIVQGHIEKTSENAAKFSKFFNEVVIPGAEATLTA